MSTIVLFSIVILFFIIGGAYLLYYLRQIEEANRKINVAQKRHYTLLKIMVPKLNTKSPLAAEQMFAAMHGIYRKNEALQEHFSIEIAATSQSINFYMLVPTQLRDFIEGQVYSQYPTVEIEASSDYSNVSLESKALAAAEITLTKNDYFPIRTFTNFDVDPLAGITGVLSKIEPGEVLAIQFVMSPIDDTWQKEGLDYVKKIKEGKSVAPPPPLYMEFSKIGAGLVKDVAKGVALGMIGTNSEEKKEEKKEVKLSGPEEVGLKGIESKVTKLGYATTIRVLAITDNPDLSQIRIQSVVGAFKQFNITNLNGFDLGTVTTSPDYLRTYRTRKLSDKPVRLNVEEIASVFHFPDSSVATPNIVWAGSKKGEPPQNLPVDGEVPANELTTFGLTSFRNRRIKFGIKANDRRLHFYAIGKTGTGKSTLIENMIYDDIKEGRGVAVVDPHGELIEHILNFIPPERMEDVVYFNPDDREHPLAFNLLESVSSDMRSVVASGLMSIFTKLWANVWSARMEYILRNAILAVLEAPNSTLLSIMRVLNDPVYRKYVMSYVSDPVVKDFFYNEYDKYDAKFRQEAIAPIQNKVGQFLSSSTIRNIVGQPKSTFSLSEIMDNGKIFLVDLSIGRIGEDNSKLLGSMMITKIQLAAMARANMAAEQRRDFYLYVDEFQNFATDSFATILSEARKYKLNLVLVNQYIAQIPEVVADAIFGNVGTMIAFRVGATDADKLVKEYEPVFDANDMINLPNRQIYVKMAIDGVTSQAFSAHTLPPKGVVNDNAQSIIERSREKYSRPRAQVEKDINDLAEADYRAPIEKEYDDLRKHPFVIDGTLYKEFSAKGGQRWYFGQPEDALTEDELADLHGTGDEQITEPTEAKPSAMPPVETSAQPATDTPVSQSVQTLEPQAVSQPNNSEQPLNSVNSDQENSDQQRANAVASVETHAPQLTETSASETLPVVVNPSESLPSQVAQPREIVPFQPEKVVSRSMQNPSQPNSSASSSKPEVQSTQNPSQNTRRDRERDSDRDKGGQKNRSENVNRFERPNRGEGRDGNRERTDRGRYPDRDRDKRNNQSRFNKEEFRTSVKREAPIKQEEHVMLPVIEPAMPIAEKPAAPVATHIDIPSAPQPIQPAVDPSPQVNGSRGEGQSSAIQLEGREVQSEPAYAINRGHQHDDWLPIEEL